MMARGVHLILLADLHDGHALRLVEEGQRVLNGSPRLPRILPADHNMVGGKDFTAAGTTRKGRPAPRIAAPVSRVR